MAFVLLCAFGCREQVSVPPDEEPGQDFELPAPTHFPTSRDIEQACSEAVRTAIRDAPGIVHPTHFDYPVRDPQCRWTEERPHAAECSFEQSTVAIVSHHPQSVYFGMKSGFIPEDKAPDELIAGTERGGELPPEDEARDGAVEEEAVRT